MRFGLRALICAGLSIQICAAGLAEQGVPPQKPAAPQAAGSSDAAIQAALQQYSAALESLDADQVKKIHPAVDVEVLKRAFRDTRELKVTIDNVKVLSVEGPTARVSCRVTQTFTPKAGARQNTSVTRVMRLRRQEATWVIDGFER